MKTMNVWAYFMLFLCGVVLYVGFNEALIFYKIQDEGWLHRVLSVFAMLGLFLGFIGLMESYLAVKPILNTFT